jgi:hypothetical protein
LVADDAIPGLVLPQLAEKYETMASSVYGHPGAPKDGPATAPVLENLLSGDFGLTFEEEGLRARAVPERKAAK